MNKLGVTVDYVLQDYIRADNENYVDQLKKLTNGRSVKELQMAMDVLKIMFSHVDEL